MSRIVVTGGGTGGHVFPALAVCDLLQQQGHPLLYVGHPDKTEARLVPQAGIPFEPLIFSGMPRRMGFAFLRWGVSLLGAVMRSIQILRRFQADRVFATGGFVTAPVLIAAWLLKIPYAVHEPDAYPGLVNSVLSHGAALTTCGFERATQKLKGRRVLFTGNPLRGELGRLSREHAWQHLDLPEGISTILTVMGGSQGAQAINICVLECLNRLLAQPDLFILHQVGEQHRETYHSALPEALQCHPRYRVMGFIDAMPEVLAVTTLVLCRAGALTLSELYRCGVPSILIPYPYAAQNHQTHNARASEQSGASLVMDESDLTPEFLLNQLEALLDDSERLFEMKQAALSLSKPRATEEIVDAFNLLHRVS
jgi:UDP-N-acetylglucosamine--N-acetylmuramyl-(pentapeptide) pyrophosphoryl-undecaprenol N-acetylglucosamine transferase